MIAHVAMSHLPCKQQEILTQCTHEPEECCTHLVQQEQIRHKDEEPAYNRHDMVLVIARMCNSQMAAQPQAIYVCSKTCWRPAHEPQQQMNHFLSLHALNA